MNDKHIRALLIEDNPGDARLIREMLKEAGAAQFELACADRLSTGLERLAERDIDVVLLDLGLPDSQGLDTLGRVLAEPPGAPVIVVLTGLDDEALAIQAVRVGAQDYLVKGQVDGNLLGRAMRYAIERQRAEEVLRESEDRYRDLVEHSHDLICTHDLQGQILSANPAAEKLLGYDQSAMLKMNLRDILAPEVRDEFDTYLATIRRDGVASGVMLVQTSTGERRIWTFDNTLRTKGVAVHIVRGMARDISERKRAEEALRVSEERFALAVRGSNAGLWDWDITNNSLYWSPRLKELLGYSGDELDVDFETFESHIHPDDREHTGTAIEAHLKDRGLYDVEQRLRTKSGEYRWFLARGQALWDEAGNPLRMVGSTTDITNRKRAEKSLQVSHHFLEIANRHTELSPLLKEFVAEIKNFTDCAAVGLRMLDEKGNIPYQAYEGFSYEFYESESPLSIKSDQCMCINVIKRTTDPKLSYYTEGGSYYINGTTRFLATVPEEEKGPSRNVCNEFGYESVALVPIRLGERILGLIHVADPRENMVPLEMVEVLEGTAMQLGTAIQRVQAEEALRESERRLKEAQALGRIGDWKFDVDNQKITWSDQVFKLYERDPGLGALTPEEEATYYSPEQARTLREYARRSIETGEEFEYDLEVKLSSGRTGYFSACMHPIKDESGRVVELFGTVQDITERKLAEEALTYERDLLQALMDNIPDTIYFKDTASRFTRINRAQAQVLGVKDPKEAIGKTDFDFFTPEHAQNAHADEQEIVKSGQPLIDRVERIRSADGQIHWVSATKVPVMDEKGRVTGTVGVSRDITERKLAEEEIRRHLERIEALREIDRAITSTLNLTEVLDIILEQLDKVIPYHSAGIYLFSEGIARLAAGKGFPDLERALQISFPVNEDPLTRELLQEKRPLVLADAQADERFLARGGREYVRSWIGAPLIAKDRAVGFLTIDHREPGVYDKERAEIVQAFASQVAIAIENARLYEEAQRELAERKRAEEELRQSFGKLQRALEGTINVLVSAIEIKDPYTAGHQRRVAELVCAIANEMSLPEDQIEGLRMAGLIHDLGKINVPAEILSKPSRLNDFEWGMIKAHPQVGYDILKTVEFPWPVAQTVLQHHERLDGSGYPQGLTGKDILMKARILAVADVVEAMASFRPYRPARGIDKALEEISQNRGILYDPEVVDACLKLFSENGFELE
ncbi:MAG: PAS domain S-box protein [Anaerolineales bacterium]|nr:PAS domain S-box protein [Anaerolineales bacterium]